MDHPEGSANGPQRESDCTDDDLRAVEPVNSFALVAYMSGPLAHFLDDLRRDLVPDCLPRAHITVLPPRSLEAPAEEAWEYVRRGVLDQPPFEVEAVGVQVFDATSVIYISLGAGRAELERLHENLNTGPLFYGEPFNYHPHITLAQDFPRERVAELRQIAIPRWAEYHGPRRFVIDTITFVQNTNRNRWLDLAEVNLRAVPSLR